MKTSQITEYDFIREQRAAKVSFAEIGRMLAEKQGRPVAFQGQGVERAYARMCRERIDAAFEAIKNGPQAEI